MLLAAKLPLSIKSFKNSREVNLDWRLNWEVQKRRRSEDDYLVCCGRRDRFLVLVRARSAEFPGPTAGWDLRNYQPSGPRMEVMRSILVHCTPSHHPPFTSSSVFLLQLLAVLPVLQFQSLQYESDTKKSFLALID